MSAISCLMALHYGCCGHKNLGMQLLPTINFNYSKSYIYSFWIFLNLLYFFVLPPSNLELFQAEAAPCFGI